jgi:hypothetical protein
MFYRIIFQEGYAHRILQFSTFSWFKMPHKEGLPARAAFKALNLVKKDFARQNKRVDY